MKSYRGKAVVVTGAASGIGRALAVRAAAEGARVALSDIDEAGLEGTRSLLPGASGALVTKVDVRSDDELKAFAARVDRELGGADVVINNAGVSVSDSAREMRRDNFEWIVDINFWGVVRGTEAFLPQLLRAREARLVNVSSIFGIVAMPSQSAYNATKFAVRGYTEALRQELRGTGVRVVCVHPGGVQTNIVRNARNVRNSYGEISDAAAAARAFERIARTTPDAAARTILDGTLRGDARVLVGADARLADLVQRLAPTSYPDVFRAAQRVFEVIKRARL